MAASAAHLANLSVSASDGSYVLVYGLDDMTVDKLRQMLPDTEFGDTAPSVFAGLKEFTISGSGYFDNADTSQALIRSSEESGATIYAKVLFDGTNGWKCACKCPKFNIKMGPTGRVEFSFELVGIAAPTVQP